MSGVKTVNVDAQEYRRLREQAARASTLQAANAALNRLNESLSNSVNRASSQISGMQTNINNLNARIASNAAAASKETQALRTQLQNEVKNRNTALAQQAQQYQRQLDTARQDFRDTVSTMRQEFNSSLEQTREEMATAMEVNNQRLENVISRNNARIRSEINDLRTTVQDMDAHIAAIDATLAASHADAEALRAQAEEFMRVAQQLNEDSQTYRCEILLPGQFSQVRQALTQAQSDIKIPGNEAVARNNARIAYQSALEFHDRIIRAEQEWILHRQAAQQSVAAAQAQIESSREVTVGQRKTPIDADYWSCGDLTRLEGEAGRLEAQLNSQDNSLEDLDQIRSAGETISDEALDAAAFAMAASINSQNRITMNANLGRQLKERAGLSLVSQSYQGGDQRAAHRMHLRNNVTGFEMIITQTPIVSADGTMSIDVDSHITCFGTNNAQIADQIARTALQIVVGDRANGPITTAPGYATQVSDQVSAADMPAWRTETNPDVARPVAHPSKKPQTAVT